MGILEIILLVTVVLFCFAFALQVVIGTWKFIYKMAPIVVPLLIIAFLLIATGNLNLNIEMEGHNASHIGSVENQSGRGSP